MRTAPATTEIWFLMIARISSTPSRDAPRLVAQDAHGACDN